MKIVYLTDIHCFTLLRFMKKKDVKPQPVVTYLKVSPYLKAWMESKYGKIISFPVMTQLYGCLSRYIVNNVSMSVITEFSFSDAAFNYQSKDSFFAVAPSDEVKDQCIAIELPESVWRGNKELETNRYWQLSKRGAIEMRQMIKNDFMIELFRFIEDCFVSARINGTKVTREQAIDDFITIYGIEMKERENLDRYVKREKKAMQQEIEKHRDEMEKKYDRQFTYT